MINTPSLKSFKIKLIPSIILVVFISAIAFAAYMFLRPRSSFAPNTKIVKATGAYAYKNTSDGFKTQFKSVPTTTDSIVFANKVGKISFFTPSNQSFGNISSSTPAVASGSTITYPDIYQSLDLRYTISSARLLEEFIVKDKETAAQIDKIAQIANTKNTYEKDDGGSIIFKNKDKVVFTLPHPVMYEEGNKEIFSYEINYDIVKDKDSLIITKVISDGGKAWLADENRKYPVVIDLVIDNAENISSNTFSIDNADTAANWTSSDATSTPVSSEGIIKQEGTASTKIQTTADVSATNILDLMEYSSDANARAAYISNTYTPATGGTITSLGEYKIHTFTSNGTFAPGETTIVDYLVVGGGGGGGAPYNTTNSQGGAGGTANSGTVALATGNNQSVIIGGGGAGATDVLNSHGGTGAQSSFGGIVGAGGAWGVSNSGFIGGNGAGGVRSGGNGGPGYLWNGNYYGGGGGGGQYPGTYGTGGTGGGGNAQAIGAASTGGGGGGGVTGGAWGSAGGSGIVVARYLTTKLQSYSEPTIKTEGTYALKGYAEVTTAANKTLTRTIVSPLNLSNRTNVTFDIRSTRTGSNIKVGLHDVGGVTTEITPNITGANAFQSVTLDLSAVTNANKDAIDKIIITIVDATAANTFYIDNMVANPSSFTLNDTVTRTTAATDLSGVTTLTYWVRSSVAGTFAIFGFGEAAATEQTQSITINSVNTWEQKTWDISAISPSARNAVTKYAFKFTSDTSGASFYFDDIQAVDPSNTWISSDTVSTPVSLDSFIKQEGSNSVKIQTTAGTLPVSIDQFENTYSGTGGTITTSGAYTIHTFTNSGVFTPGVAGNVEVLVVGGGGGTGYSQYHNGGGGGGGVVYHAAKAVSGATTVTVGNGGVGSAAGGTPGGDGQNSVFGDITALGGGYGGIYNTIQGHAGGSGGGGAENGVASSNIAGAATQGASGGGLGYGNAGGTGYATGQAAGGGGGSGGAGGVGVTNSRGGLGGVGLAFSISGTNTYYGGGGGGASYVGNTTSAGGLGGGGTGYSLGGGNGAAGAANGVPNTGGGAGGYERADLRTGGTGGSGIVIVRYPSTKNIQVMSENTIKTEGSYALKAIANQTSSLNKTLTRTIASPLNLTDKPSVTFDIRSTRTGSNIKVGLHDVGGITTEITPNITGANAFQSATLDLSAVTNANKDAIDQIIITILNADAANTFYIDNMVANTPTSINDTITRTSTVKDLSTSANLTYWVRSSVTGTFATIGFGEAAATEQTQSITINSANTWEQKSWDLTGITGTSRDAVTKFAFKFTSDTSGASFYFDDIQTNALFAPTLGTPVPLSSTSIRWVFTDNSAEEIGFKIYDSNSNLLVTCPTTNLGYCDETGLTPNTQYTRKIGTYNASSTSISSGTTATYTLAVAPNAPVVNTRTSTTVLVNPDPGTNPAGTLMAIYKATGTTCDGTGGAYIAANGTGNGATAVWQSDATWGTVSISGLTTETQFIFCVKAKNGNNLETSFSPVGADNGGYVPISGSFINSANTTAVNKYIDGNTPARYVIGIDAGSGVTNTANFELKSGIFTLNSNETLVTGSMTLTGGSLAIATGGVIKLNTPVWAIDADADGYTSDNKLYFGSAPVNGRRKYLLTTLAQADCSESLYNTANSCCTIATRYADTDGDGYGAGAGVSICPTGGYVDNNTDCGPSTATAYPGSATCSTTSFLNASGAASYDYNCSASGGAGTACSTILATATTWATTWNYVCMVWVCESGGTFVKITLAGSIACGASGNYCSAYTTQTACVNNSNWDCNRDYGIPNYWSSNTSACVAVGSSTQACN